MQDKEQIICDTYNSLTRECSGKPDTPLATQIIIDGVDVSGCGHFYIRPEDRATCCTNHVNCLCGANPNCYYKQLARKTQECEELKNNLHIANTNHEAAEQECDCYCKALEEIEGMLQVIVESNKVYPLQSNLYKILDIISKAKGEDNARQI